VTSTFGRLTLNTWCTWRVTWPTFPPSLKTKPIRSRFTTYNVSRWFSHFICWMSAIFLLPVCLTYWPRKYTTSVDTHVDNCHQVWRPYAHQFLMSYNVSGWLLLKCVQGLCACAESRDPLVGGQKQLHFWNPRPRFAYSLCNFGGSTMKVIKFICENNSRPCVKRRVSFCACA